ncbi:hypothetical protein BD779DRAFT_1783426 [Infundibulicybe gibba]|nr:hypothetical protein BD779DRAFT_1783426 [Infundibulicybe gibba]
MSRTHLELFLVESTFIHGFDASHVRIKTLLILGLPRPRPRPSAFRFSRIGVYMETRFQDPPHRAQALSIAVLPSPAAVAPRAHLSLVRRYKWARSTTWCAAPHAYPQPEKFRCSDAQSQRYDGMQDRVFSRATRWRSATHWAPERLQVSCALVHGVCAMRIVRAGAAARVRPRGTAGEDGRGGGKRRQCRWGAEWDPGVHPWLPYLEMETKV